MAKFLYLILLVLLTLHQAAASFHNHNQNNELRSLHFALYQQEIINKTGYIIVNGVAGTGVSEATSPFGTIFVFNDNMTTTPDASSRVAGIVEGASITSSLDGLRGLSIAKITLKIHGCEGSISVLGVTYNTKPSNHPVVGGTGDFMFVQGYVRSSPVDLQGIAIVYKIEFHLYWPPYAPTAPE